MEPEEPIHYVANPPELKQQAVSIHIYSYPYSSCMVYSLEQKETLEIPLHYTSEYGVLEYGINEPLLGLDRDSKLKVRTEDESQRTDCYRF